MMKKLALGLLFVGGCTISAILAWNASRDNAIRVSEEAQAVDSTVVISIAYNARDALLKGKSEQVINFLEEVAKYEYERLEKTNTANFSKKTNEILTYWLEKEDDFGKKGQSNKGK